MGFKVFRDNDQGLYHLGIMGCKGKVLVIIEVRDYGA
jgi:hypothetical protein